MITLKQAIMVVMMLTLSLSLMAGCSGSSSPRMVNELTFGLAGVNEVAISYNEENLTFYASDDGDLTVREYMTADKNSYYANVTEKDGRVHISEGGKPLNRSGFERYVVVYIPASYAGELNITSTSGTVELASLQADVPQLRIDNTSGSIVFDAITGNNVYLSTTSGRIEGNTIRADTIKITGTSGDVTCQRLEGAVSYASTSGNITVVSAAGAGIYKTSNSGVVDITYEQVTGNLTLSNKNGDVMLTIPSGLDFHFEAESKNGTISTDFQENLTVTGGMASGTIGITPSITIKITTHDGDVQVKQ